MRTAITPGEPAGIGPELIVRFCQNASAEPRELVVFADGDLAPNRRLIKITAKT